MDKLDQHLRLSSKVPYCASIIATMRWPKTRWIATIHSQSASRGGPLNPAILQILLLEILQFEPGVKHHGDAVHWRTVCEWIVAIHFVLANLIVAMMRGAQESGGRIARPSDFILMGYGTSEDSLRCWSSLSMTGLLLWWMPWSLRRRELPFYTARKNVNYMAHTKGCNVRKHRHKSSTVCLRDGYYFLFSLPLPYHFLPHLHLQGPFTTT